MTGRIFISYRRADSQYATDHICEQLVKHFGSGRVFMDIDSIPLGVNFRDYIDEQIRTSEIVLAVIGDHWLNALDEKGERRLQNPNDFVRLEIEAALKQGIKLIPIYIGNVQNLPAKSLPKSLVDLPLLNAIHIRRGNDFYSDVNKLIDGLDQILDEQATRREENVAALTNYKNTTGNITNRLSGIEASLIQEMRKRTQLEREAQRLSEQLTDILKDTGKQLHVDLSSYRSQIENLQDSLMELMMQVEARKQGKPIEQEYKPQPTSQEEIEPREKISAEKHKLSREKVEIIEKPSRTSSQPSQHRKIPLWGWGAGLAALLLVIAGFLFIPSLLGNPSNEQPEQTGEPTATIKPQASTSSNTPTADTISETEPQDNPDFIVWMKQISESTPDYIEDFSIPASTWRDGLIEDLSLEDFISSDGQLVIKDDPPERQDYNFYTGYSWNFQLQFDLLITELADDSFIELTFMDSIEDQSTQFQLKKDGRWYIRAELFKEGREQIFDSGEIDSLEEGQLYRIQITDYDGQIAILINGELLTYVFDTLNENREGFFRLTLETSQPVDVTIDNILFWDLTDTLFPGNPPYQPASFFLLPIRQYLSDTIPDFQDDFEAYQPYWDQMQVDFSDTKRVKLNSLINGDGAVKLDSTEGLEYDGFSLDFPGLYSQYYAVQYDFQFDEPIPSKIAIAIISSWGPEDNRQHLNAFCNLMRSDYSVFCGVGQFDDKGNMDQPLSGPPRELQQVFSDRQTSFLLISYDGRLAIFIDGYLMADIENLGNEEQEIKIRFSYVEDQKEDFRVRIDNLKFWKLDGVEILSNATLPDLAVQTESAFIEWTKAISSSTPDYIEDFSIFNSAWRSEGQYSEGWYSEFSESIPLRDMVSLDGKLVIQDDPSTKQGYDLKIGFGSNFQLQFETLISKLANDGYIELFFKESEDRINFFHLEKNGSWAIIANHQNEQEQLLDSGEIDSMKDGQLYSFQITDYNGNIAIFINEDLLSVVQDPAHGEGDIHLLISTSNPVDVSIDNILFWDLTDTPYLENPPMQQASSFLLPIRQVLSDTIPDFQDDFETYQIYWDQMQVYFSHTMPVDLNSLINGEGKVKLIPNPNLQDATFDLNFPNLYAQDYAIQYDYQFETPICSDFTNSVITSWGPEDDLQHLSAFCDNPSEYSVSCGLYRYDDKGRFDHPLIGSTRELSQVFHRPATFLMITYHGRLAIFLDGYLMGYIEDLEQNQQQISISLGRDQFEDFKIYFDNLKFWKLDDVDNLSITDGVVTDAIS